MKVKVYMLRKMHSPFQLLYSTHVHVHTVIVIMWGVRTYVRTYSKQYSKRNEVRRYVSLPVTQEESQHCYAWMVKKYTIEDWVTLNMYDGRTYICIA